jgi:hypothetical protein
MKEVNEVKLICNTCKSVFYRKPYRVRTKVVYCSHKCQVSKIFYEGHPSYVDNSGSNSYAWKGDDVGYVSLHAWVRRNLGTPKKCEFCNTTTAVKFEWANKSHEYKRDLTDWIRLCVPCHSRYDNVGAKISLAAEIKRTYL